MNPTGQVRSWRGADLDGQDGDDDEEDGDVRGQHQQVSLAGGEVGLRAIVDLGASHWMEGIALELRTVLLLVLEPVRAPLQGDGGALLHPAALVEGHPRHHAHLVEVDGPVQVRGRGRVPAAKGRVKEEGNGTQRQGRGHPLAAKTISIAMPRAAGMSRK